MVDVIWTMTGIILLGAMIAGGISLFLKRRKKSISDKSVGLESFHETSTDEFIDKEDLIE